MFKLVLISIVIVIMQSVDFNWSKIWLLIDELPQDNASTSEGVQKPVRKTNDLSDIYSSDIAKGNFWVDPHRYGYDYYGDFYIQFESKIFNKSFNVSECSYMTFILENRNDLDKLNDKVFNEFFTAYLRSCNGIEVSAIATIGHNSAYDRAFPFFPATIELPEMMSKEG
jgi:hypothetical protein